MMWQIGDESESSNQDICNIDWYKVTQVSWLMFPAVIWSQISMAMDNLFSVLVIYCLIIVLFNRKLP